MAAMSQSATTSYLQFKDYAAIEAAMMQSEKGRSFLRDYLNRNRAAETEMLLASIAKLQRALNDKTTARRLEALRFDIAHLHAYIARTRRQLARETPGMQQAKTETLTGALAQVEAELMAILDLWNFEPEEPVATPAKPISLDMARALRKGLANELSAALLTDPQKDALFT